MLGKGDDEVVNSSKQPIESVYGNDRCQTRDAKWLHFEDIHQKFQRPGFYDIGGTYIQDVGEYWFMYKTEQLNKIFLLHLFICNRQEASFKVGLSYSSDLNFDKKNNIAYLPSLVKYYNFNKLSENSYSYVATFTFSELDVELLFKKKLMMTVRFMMEENNDSIQEIIDDVKSSHDFGALLSDPICSDFTIESLDGCKFAVHKAILAAHSDVFKAMLKSETAESQNNYVKLVDVGKDDLDCILQFIYTGTVKDVIHCNCINLLMLADKYDLRGLSELSQHALCQQLAIDNAVEILMVADMYNSDFLKMAAMKFIKRYPSVLQTSSWKELRNADLARELCEYLTL